MTDEVYVAHRTPRERREFSIRHVGAVLSVSAIVCIVVTASHWLPSLYTSLDVSDAPRPADVILILGGGGPYRPRTAVDLYRRDLAPRIIVSGNTDGMKEAIGIVVGAGIPADAIIINDKATNTFDEAQQVLEILRELEATSALIVTDATHTRRARATYRHVFRDSEIRLTFVASESEMDASNWWRSKESAQVPLEYLKMFYYWVAYGVWSW